MTAAINETVRSGSSSWTHLRAIGGANVSTTITDRLANSRGVWPVALKQTRQALAGVAGAGPPLPGCVVLPANTAEVSAVIRISMSVGSRLSHSGAARESWAARRPRPAVSRSTPSDSIRLESTPFRRSCSPAPGCSASISSASQRVGSLGRSISAVALFQHCWRLDCYPCIRHVLDAARQHRGSGDRSRSRAAGGEILRTGPSSRSATGPNVPSSFWAPRAPSKKSSPRSPLAASARRTPDLGQASGFPNFQAGLDGSPLVHPGRRAAGSGPFLRRRRNGAQVRLVLFFIGNVPSGFGLRGNACPCGSQRREVCIRACLEVGGPIFGAEPALDWWRRGSTRADW